MALVGLPLVLLFLVGDSAGNGHQWAWQPREAEELPGGAGVGGKGGLIASRPFD